MRQARRGEAMGRACGRGPSVDDSVLAELRAIREEIRHLSERVGSAATREELDGYVRKEAFEAAQAEHDRALQSWRSWLPIVISAVALLLTIAQHVRVQ
jgi:hypothetical protein